MYVFVHQGFIRFDAFAEVVKLHPALLDRVRSFSLKRLRAEQEKLTATDGSRISGSPWKGSRAEGSAERRPAKAKIAGASAVAATLPSGGRGADAAEDSDDSDATDRGDQPQHIEPRGLAVSTQSKPDGAEQSENDIGWQRRMNAKIAAVVRSRYINTQPRMYV
jgi:hypothetical protein